MTLKNPRNHVRWPVQYKNLKRVWFGLQKHNKKKEQNISHTIEKKVKPTHRYNCDDCSFHSNRKNDYTRHILSKKHKKKAVVVLEK